MRMHGDVARLMVIEIADMRARFEQLVQRVAVFRQGDVEHGDAVACLGLDPFQQADVTLGPGDQLGIGWIGQAQLVQRADAVGIAVENVNERHGGQGREGVERRESAAIV